MLLFTEGEEAGLLGAQAFASENPLAKNIALAINIEARGTTGQSLMFQTGDDSGRHPAHWRGAPSTMRVTISQGAMRSYNLVLNDNDSTQYKVHRVR